jgi:DUF2909 family protein
MPATRNRKLELLTIVLFAAILASLAFAAVGLLKVGPESRTLLNALTLRIVLSVLLFALLLLAWYAGLIRPHGIAG